MEDIMKKAIDTCCLVQLTIMSKGKGIIHRICVPFDIGPSRRCNDEKIRYHFYDLDSPDGQHNLSLLPKQIVNIQLSAEKFNPSDFVKWKHNWFYKRDWGSDS
ncbi:MAG: hypothetical protein RR291_03905 [Clostridia bacterium]